MHLLREDVETMVRNYGGIPVRSPDQPRPARPHAFYGARNADDIADSGILPADNLEHDEAITQRGDLRASLA